MKPLLLRALLRLSAALPLRATHALGELLGSAIARQRGRLWRVSLANLKLCYPHRDADWHENIARRSLQETAKSLLECGPFWQWPQTRLASLVKQVHGEDVIEDALAEGKGMLVATPHLGAWELSCLWAFARWPMTALYKPGKQAALDQLILDGRMRFGGNLAPTDISGVRTLMKTLAKGEVVAILPDQEPTDGNGVFADFFDTPAYTMVLLNKLARKRRVPVLFAAMQRLPKGEGFELHFLRAGDEVYDPDPVVAAAAVNACVERCIEIAPEQYMWNYKRFRHLPDGGRRKY